MEDPRPYSNCVVHEDDVDWGGQLFSPALDISPTKTYIQIERRGKHEIRIHNN